MFSSMSLRVGCGSLLVGFLMGLGIPLTSQAAEPRLYRDRIRAQWLSDNERFWYRVTTGPDQQEYVLVHAPTGTKQPAFDHQRLAKALATAGIEKVKEENLQLDQLSFEDALLKFRAYGRNWTWKPDTDELAAGAPVRATRLQRASPSRRTGDETWVTFINRTDAAVELFWLDTDGRQRSYGTVPAGETRKQHTFSGHKWLAADPQGRTLLVIEAGDETQEVDIDPRTEPAEAETDKAESPRQPERPTKGTPSPNGRWSVFFNENNLHLLDTSTGQEQALTTNGDADHAYVPPVHWSPDSARVVVMRRQKGFDRKVYLIESSPSDQLQPKLHSIDYLKPGDTVPVAKPHLFEVATATEVPISDALHENPWSISDLRWVGDSSAFFFVYNQRGHQVLRVNCVDARTGQVRAVIEEVSPTFVDYSGKQFLEYSELSGRREILWASERDGWNHLYLYDLGSGRLKHQVTRGPWVMRGVERVDWENRQVWFRASGIVPGQDPYHIHHARVDLDGGETVLLTAGDGTHSVQFSPDRKFLIDTWARVDRPPLIDLRRASDGALVTTLETADISELDGDWRPPERFVAKGRDGQTDIYGLIHWPRNWDPNRKYPVVESIYAGPQGSFVPKAFAVRHGARLLADRGFVVVQIDGMGTSDRGKAFHDVAFKNLGDSGFPDRILWLRAAAQKHPSMDLTRVGIYGTSAGGQSALRALLAHGDFYHAGVADCGCHDNRVDKIWWNEQWMGWPLGPHYAEQSNVTQAHRLQGKLLLMVGELDRNVDPASTLQVVNALIKADKDFELLFMPGEGHGVLGNKYAQRRMIEFFERSLGVIPN